MNETTLDQALTQRREAHKEIINVDEPAVKLVIFALGDEYFAFQGACIHEILAQTDVFFVPGCPSSLEGVINVRGDIESVIRPHELLHLPDTGSEPSSSILLGSGGGIRGGIPVDRVVDVVDVPQSTIQPASATLPEHLRTLVLGMLRFREKTVALLDLNKMFADYARGLG